MDRTSALDSAFFHLDAANTSLHIASLAVFEGPAPTQDEILAVLRDRIAAVPRLRQRAVFVPFALGRPAWADDPDFVLTDHVRRAAVPAPGGEAELREVASRVLSEPLRHGQPLWDDTVLEGLADDRWALITRVHHAMVDGIAGTRLLTAMLDPGTDHAAADPPAADNGGTSRAGHLPSAPALAVGAAYEQVRLLARQAAHVPGASVRTARHPVASTRAAYDVARGLGAFARALVPTTATSLSGPLGRERDFHWTEIDLATALRVRHELGGTLNDVVLALVTKGFRDLELSRGENAAPRSVRCLVPVSVRPPDGASLDNEVSALVVDLPVELADARDRLNEVSVRVRALRDAHEVEAGQWVARFADGVPPPTLATILRLAFRFPQRSLTTVVTNVPGPEAPCFLAGRRMLASYPYVPIADRLRIGVAVTSYDGRLLVGVTADRSSSADLDVLVDGIASGLRELDALVPHPRRHVTRSRRAGLR